MASKRVHTPDLIAQRLADALCRALDAGHLHPCPECHLLWACELDCPIDADLTERRETPCGAKKVCDPCALRLAETFPCGHRIVDWDSYGKCVLCPLIAQAHECDSNHECGEDPDPTEAALTEWLAYWLPHWPMTGPQTNAFVAAGGTAMSTGGTITTKDGSTFRVVVQKVER